MPQEIQVIIVTGIITLIAEIMSHRGENEKQDKRQ